MLMTLLAELAPAASRARNSVEWRALKKPSP